MPRRTPYSVVLFDLGGVLVEFSGFESLPAMLADSPGIDETRRRWIDSPAVAAFERGDLPAQDFAEAFAREWELRVTPEEFLSQFIAWAKDFYPGARELVAEVRARTRVACFSNTNPLHWHRNFEAFGIPQSFDVAFASFELGAVKPEEAAFAEVVRQLECQPASRRSWSPPRTGRTRDPTVAGKEQPIEGPRRREDEQVASSLRVLLAQLIQRKGTKARRSGGLALLPISVDQRPFAAKEAPASAIH